NDLRLSLDVVRGLLARRNAGDVQEFPDSQLGDRRLGEGAHRTGFLSAHGCLSSGGSFNSSGSTNLSNWSLPPISCMRCSPTIRAASEPAFFQVLYSSGLSIPNDRAINCM